MKNIKRPLTVFLSAAIGLSLLAGCGGKSNSPDGPSDPKNSAAPSAEPEYVYTSRFVDIAADGDSSIDRVVLCGDKLLASMWGKIADNTPEGVTPEYKEQYWVYGEQLYWLTLDGGMKKVEGYAPISEPAHESTLDLYGGGVIAYDDAADSEEDADETDSETIPAAARDVSANIQSIAAAGDGSFVTLECVYQNWYDGPTDYELWSDEWQQAGYEQYWHYEQHYYIRTLNADGTEKTRTSLAELQETAAGDQENDGYFYINSMAMDDAGHIYLLGDQSIYIMDPDGSFAGTIRSDNYFDSILSLADGAYVAYWGEGDEQLAKIDPETKKLGDGMKVRNVWNAVAAPEGSEYDFYWTDGSNLMGYDVETAASGKVLNWLNCDVDTSNSNSCVALPDGRCAVVESEWHQTGEDGSGRMSMQLALVERVPYDSVPHKTPIIFASMSLGYDARGAIIKFNRNSPEYHIEVRDYSEYNTDEDYTAGLTKLTTEILAGNVPDIIDLSGMPYEQFVGRGLLADLNPLLDADGELSRDDILPAVLKALEKDGALYRTASSFELSTVAGAASIVGDTPGWTLAEFKAALAQMPEGCTPFDEYTTREMILRYMLAMEMENLIDWKTGQCHFDDPAFRDILEFAAQFPETYEYPDDYERSEEDDMPNRIASGRQMLAQVTLYDLDSYQMYQAMFGGDATFVGYPVSEGVGNALQIDGGGYAISARSAVKDQAWQFVRMFFTESYQTDYRGGLPTNRAAFEKLLKEAMTPLYRRDEKGNFVLDENGEKIEESRGSWGWASLEIKLYALKQEEADEIMDLINSTTRTIESGAVYNESDEITSIIIEDTQAYFLGQKSLDDVVRLLQSKLNILVNEKR